MSKDSNHRMHENPTRPSLRLVNPTPSAPSIDEPLITARLMLKGVTSFSKTELRSSAWTDLLDGLWAGEEVHVTHSWHLEPRPRQYQLEVALLQPLYARASESCQALGTALQTTIPQAVFRADEPAGPTIESWPARAVLRPAAAQVLSAPKPRPEHWPDRLPYASAQPLPAWVLTAPFDEPFGQTLQLQIRFAARRLTQTQLLQAEVSLRAIRAGTLRVGDPRAEPGPHCHDVELADRLADLLVTWQRFPEPGYVFDVVVRSKESISSFLLQRLGRDLFGAVPWEVQLVDDAPPLPSGATTWPLKSSQGYCGLFPAMGRLQDFGVELVGVPPERLPTAQGSMVGLAGGASVSLPYIHRTSHLCAIGGSGTGKSSFCLRLLAQDIQAGFGCGVIDPHGDLVDALLPVIAKHRRRDVVIVDIDDPDFSVALNPMSGTASDPRLRNFVASQMTDLIERLFETPASTGPMMRNNLKNAFLLAMAHPDGGSIADVTRIFEDHTFRDWLLARTDARVRDFFAAFTASNGAEHGFASWKPYLMARVLPFSQNPAMLRMLGRPSTIDLGQLMNDRRIVLFRLSKSVLQDMEVEALGSLILMQFHVAALARARIKPEQRRPFHLVVDEFHTFANDTTPTLLRESRKYGLGLTLATQSLGSLRRQRGGDLVNAVLANTATKVFFRLSSPDAALVEDYVQPSFQAGDLTRTRNHHAVVCLAAADTPAFLMRAVLPDAVAGGISVNEIRRASGGQFGTPLGEANLYLAKRHGLALGSLC